MHCPFCGHEETKVTDSRLAAEGRQIRRRRECLSCAERFTTFESAELLMPHVVKSDGSREPFDEVKLNAGMLKALEKRPVPGEAVEQAVARICHKLRVQGEREVPARAVGELVMEELRHLDEVAYVRFASVYRSFQDAEAFRETIDHLRHHRRKHLPPAACSQHPPRSTNSFLARRIGCVLVSGNEVVGEAWHERFGELHAEALALRAAGARASGATAYVTLEPCGAHGRNPPCSTALIAARVARVVYAADDPNPVKRHGARQLRAAGIDVAGGLLAEESRALNPGFHKRHESGLPWVRLKLGVSLDGRTALASGESRWITSKAARHDAQRYRARSSAVLTGIGTLLADDPALNVRLEGATRQPLRVVLDSRLRALPPSRVFERDGPTLVLAVHDDAARRVALEQAGAEVAIVSADAAGHTDINAVLQVLAARGLNEIWVEAGATLSGALLAGGHVDELIVYYAPCLLGNGARGMAELPVLASLDARLQFRIVDCQMIGEDLRVTARRTT